MISPKQIFLNHIGQTSPFPLCIDIEKAEGIYMYSSDGKRYTDLVSGVAVSNVGHCHPKVVNAVKEQVEKYMHLMVYGEIIQSTQIHFAQLLVNQLPKTLNSVYFVNSGSEATDGALKLAKRCTGRYEIVAFKNSYHGSGQGAMSVLGNEALKSSYMPMIPGVSFLEFNNLEDLKLITNKTAAVIIEPVQGEAGVIVAQKGYLKALRKRCNETGTLLIFDEIQTGFGRTGELFRFMGEDVIPDILCCAKAMGGGMPLGAFIASKDLMKNLSHDPMLGHITTFGGHPVSCAAALAQLQILLEEDYISQVQKKSELFKSLLINEQHIVEIRNAGLMMAVELDSEENCLKMFSLLTENRILSDPFIYNPTSFRIAPPLIITDEQIKETCEVIIKCLQNLS